MKELRIEKILVPIDFSPCANDALNAALQLAERFGATIHLCHQLEIYTNRGKLSEAQLIRHPKWEKKRNYVTEKLAKLKEKNSDYISEWAIWTGNLVDEINQYIQQNNIDLIVMGSHGVSGKNEYFIGSNTQKVVRKVHCPVLIIKEPLEDIDFKKVIFASNFALEEKHPFQFFKSFIKHFLPEIHLLTVHNSGILGIPLSVEIATMESFQLLAAPLECKVHVTKGLSIDHGIRSFAKELDADLIAISNHNRHPVRRIFMGSNVEALVNHSRLPVLSIDYMNEEDQN